MIPFLPSMLGLAAPSSLAHLKAQYRHALYRWRRATIQRRKIARTVHELQGCTDRELRDLGLSRADIHAVAHGSYRRG